MLSDRAFRAQLAMRGQRELFDYWRGISGEGTLPSRADLNPLRVPRLLPDLGLIDLRDGCDHGTFRLAGTRLRDVYGAEITGKRLADVFAGDCASYWRRVHGQVAAGFPVSGALRGPVRGREHIVLFWLRLPLSEDGSQVDRILCHDVAGSYAAACFSEEFMVCDFPARRRSNVSLADPAPRFA